MTFDLIIEHGRVVDGTGAPARRADVGVRGTQIAAVGDLAGAAAARRIAAAGCVVSPGFIDIHTHSDIELLAEGRAESMIRQGVTTQVTGNCGLTPAPVHDAIRADLRKTLIGPDYGPAWTWNTFGEFLDRLRAAPKATHVATLVGHGAIRAAAMGFADRQPTPEELEGMRRLAAEAMEAGAFGMSSGLVYPPGLYCDTEELIEICRVVAGHGGVYATHMRGEADPVVDSVREALRIGREAGIPVQISHHKAAGRENWGKVRITHGLIAEAARTHDVTFDIYPYTAGSANLSQLVPPWAHVGGPDAMLARLRDPAERARIVRDMVHGTPGWGNFFSVDWSTIQLSYVDSAGLRWMQGLSVQAAADRVGRDPVELAADLILEDDNRTRMVNFVIAEADVDFLLPKPESIIGSDGRGYTPGSPTGGGQPHPRSYGAFARVLARYVREKRLLSLEEGVHKMTGKPARKLKLDRRGEVREGYFADLTVFDPDTIQDQATFEAPHQFAAGVHYVIVDGHVTIDQGTLSPRLVGQLLTRGT
jgi:N-acyl-D-aspartate/D-glutamate deacylase